MTVNEKAYSEVTRAYRHLSTAMDILDQSPYDSFVKGKLFAVLVILERVVTDGGEGGLDITDVLEASENEKCASVATPR